VIVDGHLDIAENVTLFGRDLTKPAERPAMLSLPDLEHGGVAVALATVTAGFRTEDVPANFNLKSAMYSTPGEAEAHALEQIDLYEKWQQEGRIRLLRSARDLDDHLDLWRTDRRPGLVLLMEGADPIVHVDDLPAWWERGLRIVGLTFGDTRYGTGVAGARTEPGPGGLTDDGIEMLSRMAELGFSWDISHHAERTIWQGLELGFPRVCASHANARALVPSYRQLSDSVIRAIGERDGVIGIVLYNGYLDHAWLDDRSIRVTIDEQVRRHISYIGELAGWDHVGIGSDFDGGFGSTEAPDRIDSVADLSLVGEAVSEEYRARLLGENWLNFLRRVLP
jgi:membrane dipeptidase